MLEMNGTGPDTCLMADFGVSGVESSGSATRVLVMCPPFTFYLPLGKRSCLLVCFSRMLILMNVSQLNLVLVIYI